MPLAPIPWATGGGAENDIEGARLSLYASTRGARGIILPGDMRVSALPVPGPAVRIVGGACVTPNTYPGGAGQSYAMREISSTDHPVAATGSSGAAVKFLVAAIDDEQYAGGAKTNPKTDPRNFYRWVSSLDGLAFPFTELVRLDQPANTSTITQAMLTDIRRIANPQRDGVQHYRPRVSADDSPQNQLTGREANGGEYFPGGSGYANTFTVDIPWWATQMKIRSEWLGMRFEGGRNCWGSLWVEYGTEYRAWTWPGKQQWEFATQKYPFDTVGIGTTDRKGFAVADTRTIPAKLRGKTVTFAYKAGLATDSQTGVSMDSWSGLTTDITFIQQPVADWQGAA